MREARKRRIGRWIPQEPKHCWLASVCIATGYMYSKARQARYDPLTEAGTYDDITDEIIVGLEEPFSTLWRTHQELIVGLEGRHVRMHIPSDAHGVIHMYTRGYQHTVAVIDGMIVDPDPQSEEYAGNETWAEHCKRNRLRPTVIMYEEIRP